MKGVNKGRNHRGERKDVREWRDQIGKKKQ
jgi:hypothetical protein